MKDFEKLYTTRSKELSSKPWDVYPRPLLKRNSFYNLNGNWDFAVTNGVEPENYTKKILVPFPPESLLSGVNQVFSEDDYLWYKTEFSLPQDFIKSRVLLHFGAVDQIAEVFINSNFVGSHKGGYEAFCFDITDYLQNNNTLVVKVADKLSNKILPYGKQSAERGGMWYTSVSGIWQTVWLESVPEEFIESIKIDTTLNYAKIQVNGISKGEITVFDESCEIKLKLKNGCAIFKTDNPKLWSPENPYLYRFKINSSEDEVESYFALRSLKIAEIKGKKRLLLNEKLYFFHGLLDQGYFSDGIFTPATPECFTDDIKAVKSLGFNMLRKHIKVEPQLFYYECDRLGIAVFQDMVNNSDYSFLRDTALPTISLTRKNDKRIHKNPDCRNAFMDGMFSTVNQLYNHPSIVCWTIFNEGWGQFCADEMYNLLKSLDSTRFIDSASGWFKSPANDFESLHIYFKKLKIKPNRKPIIISEFGGYSYKILEHSFNKHKTYGYKKFVTREDFVKAFCSLYENQVLPLIEKGLCAAIYTQVSDVEDETNGILTYDRKVLKIKPEEFKPISDKLCENNKQ